MSMVKDLKRWLLRGKVAPVFLAGSGISVPSGLPSGWTFNESLAEFLGDSARRRRQLHSWLVTGPSQQGIRFEQVMEALRDSIDRNLRILEFCEANTNPTFLHRFLARVLEEGPVITTN